MKTTFPREFYITPAMLNGTKRESDTGVAVAYLWVEERGGKRTVLAKGFSGKSNKPAYFINFGSNDAAFARRDQHVAEFFSGAEGAAKLKADRKARLKAAKAAIDSSKIADGTIFVHSWGWEQTNVDFYKVVGRKSRTKILVQPIGCKHTERETGPMAAYVTADPTNERGEVIEVTLTEQDRFHVGNSAGYTYGKSAHLWDGRETYSSWYA